MKILQVDLDRCSALRDFTEYQNNPLQPKNYNIFIHNPPFNPENRVIISPDGERHKVILSEGSEPLEWVEEDLGKTWDWADNDVLAWVNFDGQLYCIELSTVKYKVRKLRKLEDYFNNLISQGINIYEDPKLSRYLPAGMSPGEMYKRELSNIREQLAVIGLGFLRKDKEHPELIIEGCLPEDNLSNQVLEKWHSTLQSFATSNLEEVKFSQGNIA